MTKEKLIEGHMSQETRGHTTRYFFNYLTPDDASKIMDEWAKIMAIEFDKWKDDNFLQHIVGKFIQRGYDRKYEGSFTLEELYGLFLKSNHP